MTHPGAARHDGGAPAERYAFFLGGADLEMEEIRRLLVADGSLEVHDDRLAWGARASRYAAPIADAIARGKTAVLVELEDDLGLPPGQTRMVDHHGARAGRDTPTALEQVFALLGRPAAEWSRWRALISANDRGYVEEMLALGATRDEMLAVRQADRQAQGVTEDDEREAERAAAAREEPCGDLTIVRVRHARTAPVTDRLHAALGGPGFRNLLVICPGETYFFGEGRHVLALAELRHGFHGGALPDRGFWGLGSVEGFVREQVCGAAS